MTELPPLPVMACEDCHGRFLPRPGPCPRCGSARLGADTVPPTALVLAATELLAPSAGWAAPHRLVLVEAPEEVRVLALAPRALPPVGATVTLRERDGRYEVDEIL